MALQKGKAASGSSAETPQSLWAFIWRLLHHPALPWALAIVLFLSCLVLLLAEVDSIGPVKFRPSVARKEDPGASQKPSVPAILATFGNFWPNANTGAEWHIFNDNKFLGRSSVWYETVLNSESDGDHFLRVYFNLKRGARSQIGDAYVGIYLELAPPLGSASLSRYSGMKFRARHSNNSPTHSVRYLVSLANPKIPGFAYHEYEFTRSLSQDARFSLVEVPFAALHQPEWYLDRLPPFDPSNVFRISFIIRGVEESGYLDIDDLVFREDASSETP
jgi:hypothetical protein